MITTRKPYTITRGKVIFDYGSLYCDTSEKLLRSELFEEIVDRFIEKIASKGSPIFAYLIASLPHLKRNEMAGTVVNLFRLLSSHTAKEIITMNSEYRQLLSEKEYMYELIEELYNYWRRFERLIFIEAPKRSRYSQNSLHHSQFIKANEEFKNLVLYVYRRISENLMGKNPRVYRQLPAGANMDMLLEKIDWNYPELYAGLKDIPFIRLSLIEPPLILYPKMNTRKGRFEEIKELTKEMITCNPGDWYCFPAKVGDLTAFMYFHHDFISLGLSLSNLFEIADRKSVV